MKLTTILLNWRTPEMTLKAAEAALRELPSVSGKWNVVIVDNHSRDGSEEVLRNALAQRRKSDDGLQWDRVELVQSGHNGGFGAGNNFAMRRALRSEDPPEYFYILNSDAFPDPDSIRLLVEYLDTHAQVGIVGSYIHGVDGEPHVTAFRFPSVQSEIEGSLRLGVVSRALDEHVVPIGIPETTREVDWLAGASMMIRRSVLEQVGLFDESFFLYFEETDLCHRTRDAGWKVVYVKESSVAHVGSASTGMKTWKKVPEYWFDSRRHYFLKNHGPAYTLAATTSRVLGSAVWQVRRRLQSKPDEDPPGFLPGLLRHSSKHALLRFFGGVQRAVAPPSDDD
jgi:hypothetical protein